MGLTPPCQPATIPLRSMGSPVGRRDQQPTLRPHLTLTLSAPKGRRGTRAGGGDTTCLTGGEQDQRAA